MTVAPLILKGNLSVGGVVVSQEVTALKISASVDLIEIPATLDGDKSDRGGGVEYAIQIDYLSSDGTQGVLFPLLWAALGTASKELAFSGNMTDATPGAANPTWTGTFIVTEASVGGAAETLSTGGATFPLKTAPVHTP